METFQISIKGSVTRSHSTDELLIDNFEARLEGDVDVLGIGIASLMNKHADFKKIVEICAQHSGNAFPNRLFFACDTTAGVNGKIRSKCELTGVREKLIDYIVHKMKVENHICEVMTQAVAKYYASINT